MHTRTSSSWRRSPPGARSRGTRTWPPADHGHILGARISSWQPEEGPLDAHLIRPRQDKPSSIRTPPGIIKHACPPGGTERGRTNVAEPWLSADDIAAHLGITKDTVYTWIAEKAMPAHKVGRLWKFQTSEIDEWVRRGGASASTRDEDAE